jgi:hydroxymethylglutaryl-CoA synthase
MIFNNWLSWVKKDEKIKVLVQEIGEENSEDWVKKAYKSNLYQDFIKEKIMPGEIASSQIGNMYTASIFMSLLSMLSHQLQNSNNIIGDKVGFISYGSGSKSKIFNGTLMKDWKEKIELVNLFDNLSNRQEISFESYQNLHTNKNIDPITNHSVRFSHLQNSPNSKGYRKYKL